MPDACPPTSVVSPCSSNAGAPSIQARSEQPRGIRTAPKRLLDHRLCDQSADIAGDKACVRSLSAESGRRHI